MLVGGKALAEDTAGDNGRYWAFISYSHRDAAFGRRLHRKLETYALPRRLVGRATQQGVVPSKLTPIFRDREDLPAAHDLTTEVRAALRASRSLIVVCSPSAAASYWVGREIEVFRELHPDRPILAAIRDGEPKDCFHPALHVAGAEGTTTVPLAADFRRGRDGEHLGLLRLVAGMIGLGLDELIQRDNQRRNRRVTAVTAASLAGMIVMGVLTAFAVNARQDAERQRGEALGLVKFMSTDLRRELADAGREDFMSTVNSHVLEYFDHEAGNPSVESLAARAQTIQAIGEDEEAHGNYGGAIKHFREAWQTTAAQLARSPNEPERIYDHAQSEYWLGQNDYDRNDVNGARHKFESYEHLSEKLVAISPHNPRYLRELAFAEGDLCTVYLHLPRNAREPKQDTPAALVSCSAALANMRDAKKLAPGSAVIEHDLANRESWLGSAYWARHDIGNALAHWQTQENILSAIRLRDPFNVIEINAWVSLQRNLARIDVASNHKDQALKRLTTALNLLEQTILIDPANKSWVTKREKIKTEISQIQNPSEERKQP